MQDSKKMQYARYKYEMCKAIFYGPCCSGEIQALKFTTGDRILFLRCVGVHVSSCAESTVTRLVALIKVKGT